MPIFTKRVLVGLMAILGALFLLPTTTFAASQDAPTGSQCTGAPLPAGWIIISHTTDWSQCGGNPLIVGNRETIAPPPATNDPSTSIACEDSPLPTGAVIIAQVPLAMCETGNVVQRTGGVNEFVYLAPRDLMVRVCASSPIPPRWVIFNTRPIPPTTPEDCQLDLHQVLLDRQQGLNQYQPSFQIERVTGLPMTICSFSPTPVGYSRQEITFDANCGPSLLNAARIVPSPQAVK